MEHDPSDMEIEQESQDPSTTEDGSEITPTINANAHEVTSGHDDIDAEVSKLIRYSCWNNCSNVLQFYTFCFVSLQSDKIELRTIPH
ncbi:hypothetical protein G6F46_014528 [Rhizopus delemar]|uniref:Uncharacterized protein n=3 Tax=Rhizopus TaxID=4842 RepID=I1CGA6_RHIO9|nr:hypothetical protein RO3G_12197 [Rhizopus delemar RA 99-880]KAG1436453.1 hypothetical protein G6F55_014215 [Rhizopus delemar]KAG1524971.1 hypothetical protein G6F51_014389 [Rhizopus arrhizus]KAG1476742.1 hypothetical protein G6F54_014133 [Rhizopus delemar]KAG1486992.1 hypothetical protein G6F53_013844 [Rhizopus delemar]|eukprot:EIE87486.1 hypothetical protein RO3G_12197 [Rhizopus delemar RA 99-880]